MTTGSIADDAVAALAAVRAMDAGITNDDPHRHIVRSLKRNAEAILIEAFRRSHELAYQAEELGKLMTRTAPSGATGG